MPSPIDAAPRFAAAVSILEDTAAAAREACRQVKQSLDGALGGQLESEIDMVAVFASPNHGPNFVQLAGVVAEELAAKCAIGCTGESIVCNAREYESRPALAVWASRLPGVSLVPMQLDFQATPEGGVFVGWPDDLPEVWPAGSALVLLGEPFSFPADVLLAQLNEGQPGVPVVGGMASGGHDQGQNRLLLRDKVLSKGAAAVLIHGPLGVHTVVSQGCRPIGHTFVVTKADRNVILELGGKSPLAQLQEMFNHLSAEDQQLARRGLHVGQVIDEYRDKFACGDFLIRNVQGVDPDSGAIAIGDWVRVGQTVQFHVRDSGTADEDLSMLLSTSTAGAAAGALGALLFTCNGRGTRLFDAPDHDAGTLARHFQDLPTAGFFAQGEIGPVAGKNFLHGFTASIALFTPPA